MELCFCERYAQAILPLNASFLTIAAVALPAIQLCAAEQSPPIDKQMALNAIVSFREDPFSDVGRGCRGIIINFAEQSHEVSVFIGPKTVPFLSNKSISLDDRSTLLAAFTAGNIDSQLLRHQKRDDSYSGVLQVIETYKQMQRKNPKLRIADVEKFVEMEKRGELKRYVSHP
jgi:hypothetical protein